jgi:hypothetical protein
MLVSTCMLSQQAALVSEIDVSCIATHQIVY